MSKHAASSAFVRAFLSALFGATALVSISSQAAAAEAEAEAEAEDEDAEVLQEVQVTGTRIQNPNVTASNPVTSITGEEMRRLGFVNVADALTQLVPQNLSTYTPGLTGDNQSGFGGGGMDSLDRGSYFIGNTIANLRGLDPTFGSRTLTLVDGRRVASTSNQADVVDMNTIPTSLLERMDVVTGGASATYGSGAVAGVVNLVLNRRMQGLNFDTSYSVAEAGDGGSPSMSISGGLPLFGGKGHLLLSAEWQKTDAIRNCAAARSWCNDSRAMFTNSSGSQSELDAANRPLVGYGDTDGDGISNFPARFETANVRYEQRYAEGAIYHNDAAITSGYHFDPLGFGGSQYAYGLRGGASTSVVNGSGLPVTTTQPLQPSNERKVFFTNFEYDFNERTSGYLQARYANTSAENRNQQTTGNYCVRFNSGGVASSALGVGEFSYYTQNPFFGVIGDTVRTHGDDEYEPNVIYPPIEMARSTQFSTANLPLFMAYLQLPPAAAVTGWSNASPEGSNNNLGPNGELNWTPTWAPVRWPYETPQTMGFVPLRRGLNWPYWIPYDLIPNGPSDDFGGRAYDSDGNQIARGKWRRVQFSGGPAGSVAEPTPAAPSGGTYWNPYHRNDYWVLESVEMLGAAFDGSPLVLPQLGRNSNAFLSNLSPEALQQVQQAFNNADAATTAGNFAVQNLYGGSPCAGMTTVRKLWNPQIQRETESDSDTYSVTLGARGRWGSDWRWDTYYQYGATDSSSRQYNVATNLRMAFALDSVIDDRPLRPDGSANPTYGMPICRVTRDGIPLLNGTGRPLSDPAALAALGEGCQPLNVFGTQYSTQETFGDTIAAYEGIYYDAAELQRQALAYAFVNSRSAGNVSLQTLALNTDGTLWNGWAGPLTAAFGVELRENKTDNVGTTGDVYQRADLASVWADAFGGTTRVTEAYSEFNMPLVSAVEGVNLLSVNAAVRYGWYHNKGGAGTTGESATQETPNWKFSALFEPFDWVRLRVTRSRDLRAADYRDLFVFQPSIPDEFTIRNPWRPGTPTSNENQQELYGQVRVGNANLKPEKSDTLTLGAVFSPGGWAQGMRLSVDYYDIRVKDGINTPFNGDVSSQVVNCFERSNGGREMDYFNETGETPLPPDMRIDTCKEITFARQLDENGNEIPGSVNLYDLVSYNSARPQNSLPYQRRGIDYNVNYNFPLNRMFESLPGTVALNVRASQALESSGIQQQSSPFGYYGANPSGECGAALDRADPMNHIDNDLSQPFRSLGGQEYVLNRYQCVDMVGQIRSSVFIPGVASTPEWSGNITGSYMLGDLTTSLLMRYTGGAKYDLRWTDDPEDPRYWARNSDGEFLLDPDGNRQPSNASIDNNTVKPYVRFDLTASYNLPVASLKQLRIMGSVTNLFDKSPPFTGGGISGATAGMHDTLGRFYRLGVQARF